jgi:hypothetical protein
MGLWAKTTQEAAWGASCTPTSGGLPTLHGKGHMTAKAARWVLSEVEVGLLSEVEGDYRKKGW